MQCQYGHSTLNISKQRILYKYIEEYICRAYSIYGLYDEKEKIQYIIFNIDKIKKGKKRKIKKKRK